MLKKNTRFTLLILSGASLAFLFQNCSGFQPSELNNFSEESRSSESSAEDFEPQTVSPPSDPAGQAGAPVELQNDPVLPPTPVEVVDSVEPKNLRCGPWDEETKGYHLVENNIWNKGYLQHGADFKQCVGIGATQPDGANRVRFTWDWPDVRSSPVSEIKAFPQVMTGQSPGRGPSGQPNLPILTKDIGRFITGYRNLSGSAAGTKGHLAYDMRFLSDCVPRKPYTAAAPYIVQELLVVMEQYQSYGAHPGGRSPAWFRGTYDVGRSRWQVYIQPGATNTDVVVWVPERFPGPNPVNVKAMIDWQTSTRKNQLKVNPYSSGETITNPNWCFTSNSLGVEIDHGVGDITFDVFTEVERK